LCLYLFWWIELVKKAVRKMLLKLTLGLTSEQWNHFHLVYLHQDFAKKNPFWFCTTQNHSSGLDICQQMEQKFRFIRPSSPATRTASSWPRTTSPCPTRTKYKVNPESELGLMNPDNRFTAKIWLARKVDHSYFTECVTDLD